MERILVCIATKDRPTEVALLLDSLRNQTYQKFDIMLIDDGSGTPIQNYYFISLLLNKIKYEGHEIYTFRNNEPTGVSNVRQQAVDFLLQHMKHDYLARLDDDSIAEPNYLQELINVVTSGYDIACGVVPNFNMPTLIRDINNVSPIIGYCELDGNGSIIANFDDCGSLYTANRILLTPHFRSSALFKREVFEKGVNYKSRLSKNGFREEQIISFKAIIAGFKIGCNTGAILWHLNTPSGGERDTMNMGQFNQEVFEETTKRMFEDNGDFIEKYYKDNIKDFKPIDRDKLSHALNLVMNKPVRNLLNG
jgi:glycosyltransferase involved in cell wall biosynthesis